jgi:hypothetical protein
MQSGTRPRTLSRWTTTRIRPDYLSRAPAGRLAEAPVLAARYSGSIATATLGALEVGRTTIPLMLRSHLDRHPHNPAASNVSTPACIIHVAQRGWRHARIEPAPPATSANALLTEITVPMRSPAAQALLLPGEMRTWRRNPPRFVDRSGGWLAAPARVEASDSGRSGQRPLTESPRFALSAYNCGLHCNVIFWTLQLNSVGFSV